MLGEIESVYIHAQKPDTGVLPPGVVRLDHGCGKETVTFRVNEYLQGKGDNRVELTRILPSYNCTSSWRGVPVSPAIAMRSDWDDFSIFRGIVILTNTNHGYYLIDDIDKFLDVANIHLREKKVELTDLLEPLKEEVVRTWNGGEGTNTLKRLEKLGILTYQSTDVDLNENCISGCEKGNIIQTFEVKYLKGISIDKLRKYSF